MRPADGFSVVREGFRCAPPTPSRPRARESIAIKKKEIVAPSLYSHVRASTASVPVR